VSSDRSTGADDWMGTDVIDFRSRGGGVNERVVVTINGVELSDLWVGAKQHPVDPVGAEKVIRSCHQDLRCHGAPTARIPRWRSRSSTWPSSA
jgi:hypothetical protein